MTRSDGSRSRARGRAALVLGLALVAAAVQVTGRAEAAECRKGTPADAFSARVDALLIEVEGTGFPEDANLETWRSRRDVIQENLARLLELTADDPERRQTAVHVLIAAESLLAPAHDARRLGSGPETGEVRAWARSVLKGYNAVGITRDDLRAVNRAFISTLQDAWADQTMSFARRSVPVYQTHAAALRGLATFEASSRSSSPCS